MKKHSGWWILCLVVVLCGGAVWLVWQKTAEYPELGTAVSYPVNEVEGFNLTMETPSFSPFRGYTIRYKIAIDSPEVYRLIWDGDKTYDYLEREIEQQWYRLESHQGLTDHIWGSHELGGENIGFESSIVQKYAGYGTRLEAGTYRLVLEMEDADGNLHHLSAEFVIE